MDNWEEKILLFAAIIVCSAMTAILITIIILKIG